MKLILPYPPSVNRYWRTVRGITMLSAEARAYKKLVSQTLFVQGFLKEDCMTQHVRVEIAVFRPRKAGDLDNTLKAILDSIKGIAYEDDGQIVEIHAKRFDDKDRPRVEIEIKLATPGI